MVRYLLVAAGALGWIAATSPAHAQLLPVPFVPPLPLPPLPLSDFTLAPDRTDPVADAERPPDTTTPATHANVDIPARPASEAEILAFRRSQSHETWYGWQTLAADATAIGTLLFGAALVTSRPPALTPDPRPLPLALEAGSLGLYAVGPSVVHFAHGGVWKGLGSIGLRFVMPLAGFAAGYFMGGASSRGANAQEDSALGGLLGGVGAMAADAAVLGWDRWYGLSPTPSAALFSIQASL